VERRQSCGYLGQASETQTGGSSGATNSLKSLGSKAGDF
jgi:hypothetical protein